MLIGEGDMDGGYWVLDSDKNLIQVDSVEEWARFFESGDRIMKQETIGESQVSTVFLGIDHRFGSDPPLLFETMVFGGKCDGHQERCSTWKQAEEMHERVCGIVRDTDAQRRTA